MGIKIVLTAPGRVRTLLRHRNSHYRIPDYLRKSHLLSHTPHDLIIVYRAVSQGQPLSFTFRWFDNATRMSTGPDPSLTSTFQSTRVLDVPYLCFKRARTRPEIDDFFSLLFSDLYIYLSEVPLCSSDQALPISQCRVSMKNIERQEGKRTNNNLSN